MEVVDTVLVFEEVVVEEIEGVPRAELEEDVDTVDDLLTELEGERDGEDVPDFDEVEDTVPVVATVAVMHPVELEDREADGGALEDAEGHRLTVAESKGE